MLFLILAALACAAPSSAAAQPSALQTLGPICSVTVPGTVLAAGGGLPRVLGGIVFGSEEPQDFHALFAGQRKLQ
ncbi:MAG: hypothetical protein Q8O90_08920 [Elusimicrobiota bacterium]|nr:hypothetical protein [Elusimicrobiota bacterium]